MNNNNQQIVAMKNIIIIAAAVIVPALCATVVQLDNYHQAVLKSYAEENVTLQSAITRGEARVEASHQTISELKAKLNLLTNSSNGEIKASNI